MALALLSYPYSPECVEEKFSEVRTLPWCSEAHTALEHILFAHKGVCCLRYVTGRGSDTFLPSPLYRERRSLYETYHTASGHHDPNPFGSKRGGAGGGDRLRRSTKLGRRAWGVHPEGYQCCRSGRHYRSAGSSPRGRGDPQGRDKAARRRRRRD